MVVVINLGGTITSVAKGPMQPFYPSSSLSIKSIISRLPQHPYAVNIHCEDFVNMVSHDITFETLLLLAKKIAAMVDTNEIRGIVITQGTNALEEVAYFIQLLIKSDKPIVFTGAMRPVDALGYDGDRNLYNAITIANSREAIGKGVLVTFNDSIVSVRDAAKINPSIMSDFSGNDFALLGYVHRDRVYFYRTVNNYFFSIDYFDCMQINHLPSVTILFGYIGANHIMVEAAVSAKFQGIIVAGMGSGYMPKQMKNALCEAGKRGVIIVRCSRTGQGVVHIDEETDKKYGFIAGGMLTPSKARILLMLALTVTKNKNKLQRIFTRYSLA